LRKGRGACYICFGFEKFEKFLIEDIKLGTSLFRVGDEFYGPTITKMIVPCIIF